VRWPDKRAEPFGLPLIFCFFCITAKDKGIELLTKQSINGRQRDEERAILILIEKSETL